jgi:hypothetical protein
MSAIPRPSPCRWFVGMKTAARSQPVGHSRSVRDRARGVNAFVTYMSDSKATVDEGDETASGGPVAMSVLRWRPPAHVHAARARRQRMETRPASLFSRTCKDAVKSLWQCKGRCVWMPSGDRYAPRCRGCVPRSTVAVNSLRCSMPESFRMEFLSCADPSVVRAASGRFV